MVASRGNSSNPARIPAPRFDPLRTIPAIDHSRLRLEVRSDVLPVGETFEDVTLLLQLDSSLDSVFASAKSDGSDLVVTAIADAREAALSIVSYLESVQAGRKSALRARCRCSPPDRPPEPAAPARWSRTAA